MGCPGDPWIPAARRGRADLGSHVDREGRRAPSLLSGLGRRQSRAHLGARASPRIPSHLAVLSGLEVPEALSDPRGPRAQGALVPP